MKFKRCLFILADGATTEVFNKLLSNNELPGIRKHILEREGIYKTAVTSFPSTTGPAYIPFLTGAFSGSSNIPGIRWFDRMEANKFLSLKKLRSYVGPGSYLMSNDMNPELVTLFELFKNSVAIMPGISNGVSFFNNKLSFLQIPLMLWAKSKIGRMDILDNLAEKAFLKAVDSSADLVFYVNHALDEYSHNESPFSKRVINCYKKIDTIIANTAELLIRRSEYESTLLIILSDHGHSETFSHFDLDSFLENNGLKTLYYPKLQRSFLNFEAVSAVSGNSMAHLYLKHDNNWEKTSFFNNFREKYKTLLNELLKQEAVDFLAYREEKELICVEKASGKGFIKASKGELSYNYKGKDPLGLDSALKNLNSEEALRHTVFSEYPDSLVQLSEIFKSQRCGDVVISAKPGYDLRAAKYEIPEHKSSHGSLYKSHMLVPFFINVPLREKFIRTCDVFPTILRLCGKELPHSNQGRVLI